ncbi:MAG: 4-hydroxybenzoate 3-monooxygenase [Bacteroidia bacterium]|nr:4-hydroxybenzoate 3-monooxygenase [Bacteroidia bacterium]
MKKIETQLGIIGAGPAGLLLGQMLYKRGIDSVIIEKESRHTIENRVRAGVLEARAVKTFVDEGVGERLLKDRMLHKGISIAFNGSLKQLDFESLEGEGVSLYGQRYISRDMIEVRLKNGQETYFSAEAKELRGLEDGKAEIVFEKEGEEHLLICDFIAGCDSYEGIGQASIPQKLKNPQKYLYPYGWLALLVEAAPSFDQVLYAHHPRGFALASMRSPELCRYYLQCDPGEDPNHRSEEEIWEELELRIGRPLNRGKMLSRAVTPMRNEYDTCMSFGRLFLAGDAAHIVPPTGAKGLNLAIGDVRVLAKGLEDYYTRGDKELLDNYAEICLDRILKVQSFSWWMTNIFHIGKGHSSFDLSMQIASLNHVCSSKAAGRAFAENYLGLPYAY